MNCSYKEVCKLELPSEISQKDQPGLCYISNLTHLLYIIKKTKKISETPF